ncbi:retron system putative HNH endonuclease [Hymenobacter sp.]|uniref:retron system putative HNH endonuclease n=1 Tax=Hymenobacter sp. TaxID=1898978 RepID=UPI002D800E02|nr:retron system putative HNH endonuclease [Hymenobacter sp.]
MQWTNVTKDLPNFNYESIDQDTREAVLKALVKEQGGLCAYTGRSITAKTCHIEHVLAQTHCKKRGLHEDVSYYNMVACVPKPNTTLAYGAIPKKSWPDPDKPDQVDKFVSPLSDDCERRFVFRYSGKVHPAEGGGKEAAAETIKKLCLDNAALIRLRQSAILSALSPKGKPLPLSHVKQRLRQLETQTGEQEEFCFVLKQVLRQHIASREGK